MQCHTESIRFARLDSHSFCTVYRKKTKFCNSKETLLNVYNIKSKSKTWKSWIMQENILVFSLEIWIGMSNYCHQNNMQDGWKLKKNPCFLLFLVKKKKKTNKTLTMKSPLWIFIFTNYIKENDKRKCYNCSLHMAASYVYFETKWEMQLQKVVLPSVVGLWNQQ